MAFSWYKVGTVDHTKVPSDQTNFTVLVSVIDADLKVIGSGGYVNNSSGHDIVFKASGGATVLSWEIERYISTTGELIAHVLCANVSSTSTETAIWMTFGDASISTFQGGSLGAAWDSFHKLILHFPNGTTLTANDSSANALNATLVNSPTAVAAVIGGGAACAAASEQNFTRASGFPTSWTTFSFSCWFTLTTNNVGGTNNTSGTNLFQSSQSANGWSVLIGSAGVIDLTERGVANNPFSNLTVVTGKVYFVVVTRNGSSATAYLYNKTDGTSVSQTITVNNSSFAGDAAYYIARLDLHVPGVVCFNLDGGLDELEVHTTDRSANWAQTRYNNAASPSTFITWGSKISATATKTQSGKARIRATTTKTQTGKANVRATTTKTQLGKADIRKSTSQTQLGKADIKKSITQTQTGKSRIRVSVSQTQPGKSRVQKSVTQTQTGKANVRVTTTKTQVGKADISKATAQTQLALAAIRKTVTKTQTGKSAILVPVAQTQLGKARITATATKTQTGKANVKNTTSKPQLGKAFIGSSTSQIQTGKADIRKSTSQTQPGKSRVQKSVTQTQPGKSRIRITSAQTQLAKARIQVSTVRTQTGKASVRKTTTQTQLAKGKLVIRVAQTQLAKARIHATVQQTLPASYLIRNTTTKTQTGKARVSSGIPLVIDNASVESLTPYNSLEHVS